MLFPREGILSQGRPGGGDAARSPLPTVAEPAWFAPPIDARQDEDALTLEFRVDGYALSDLKVKTNGRNLFIWGPPLGARDASGAETEPRRAMRVFALPFDASPRDLAVWQRGDLLRVRIAKRRARASSDRAARAA